MGARLAIVLGCNADHGPSKSQAQKGSPHCRADYSANNMLCSKEIQPSAEWTKLPELFRETTVITSLLFQIR